MKSPTYWTNIVISPNNSPADIAMAALLHSVDVKILFLYQCHQLGNNNNNNHTWQHFLLYADKIDHNGAKDEPVQEHDSFEAAVPEECTDNSEDEVDGANSGSVGVVLSYDLEVLLQYYFSNISVLLNISHDLHYNSLL